MSDPRFNRAVIYVCVHTDEMAMGLVVNRILGAITFPELLKQLSIEVHAPLGDTRVHYGGPCETGRGFVLHTTDFVRDQTLQIDDDVALTSTVDILRAIADGAGPAQSFLGLGYAGWGPGQLDREMQNNGWLHAPADPAILFDADLDTKWERAIAKLGGTISMLSGEAGHA
jgi:putative transcriptional regulator